MAYRRHHEAARAFQAAVGRALSCVTNARTQAVPRIGGAQATADTLYTLVLNRNEPAPLRAESDLALAVIHRFRVINESARTSRPYRVISAAYYYALTEGDGREILAYHWHPEERGAIPEPHLHIESGAGTLRAEFDRAHLPTGRVALEDFLRLLIRDFAVRPLRSDWEAILNQTQQEAGRTWRR